MDELIQEVRLGNQLFRLAFGQAIEKRQASLTGSSGNAKVLAALGDELSMEALQKASGLARSSVYAVVATLERQGVIEKPRRGYVAISRAAAPYLPGVNRGDAAPK